MGWFAEQGFAPAIDWKALPRKSQPALEGTPVRSTCPRQHRHRRSCADHGIWRRESGTDPAVRNQQGYRLAMSRQALWRVRLRCFNTPIPYCTLLAASGLRFATGPPGTDVCRLLSASQFGVAKSIDDPAVSFRSPNSVRRWHDRSAAFLVLGRCYCWVCSVPVHMRHEPVYVPVAGPDLLPDVPLPEHVQSQ